ncbi:MAG: isochorismatase family protein [Acidimicrobiia bacterium]|nr:isochorismatase family protein [Acidimicrobiia bacterium]
MEADDTDLTESYRRSGFGQQLGIGDQLGVLVVDVCRAYADPDSPLFADCQPAFDACASLVATARENQVPVVWTRVRYQPGGADGGLFYQKVGALSCFDEGNPLGDWLPDLVPVDDEVVITKQYASSFFGTSLASTLNAKGIDTLLIGGVSTSGCVRASGLDALQHGFRPLVVADACGDRDQRVHDANLFDLGAKYADVIDLETAEQILTKPA